MGIGDEIMAAGQARQAMLRDPRRVRVVDINGQARWHSIWDGNPRLARPEESGDFQVVCNGPGVRPYIAGKSMRKWLWQAFCPTPGEIYLTESERAYAAWERPQVVIEPTLKARASPNKMWTGWRNFARLAYSAGIELVQLGTPGTPTLYGVRLVPTPDFRSACAVLSRARAYVGHEGGLHHAAAALGVPAVVIFGAFISPAQTGYAQHRNLYAGGEPCGMRVPCRHCADAMQSITPEMVMTNLKELLHAQ